jgi:photosystem II stability/assembly factor-like uncharacterized protein
MKKINKILSLFVFIITCSVFAQTYSWFPVNSGTTANLNYVSDKWIVGSAGTLLNTTNNGLNWIVKQLGVTNDLKCFYNNSTDLFLIVGSGGIILRSTNNGSSWSTIPSGVTTNLNSISRATPVIYFAAGNAGKILKTTDAGLTWASKSSGTVNDLNSIYMFGYYGWAAGNNGLILRTTDWGETWNSVNSGVSINLNSIIFANINNGTACGNNGIIIQTTNGGLNWSTVQSGTAANLYSINYSLQWISGSGGTILRSTNSTNWVIQSINTTLNLNSIYFPGGTETEFVCGSNGIIFNRRYDSLYTNWKRLTPNNIGSYIINTGVFNQNVTLSNAPGFEWPLGSGKCAIFTTGLTIGAKYNGALRMAAASYKGEYTPGYIFDSSGISVARTDNRFRIYSVKRGDNASTNQNWAEWGQMVPFGAPYVDVNHNNQYEPAIDTPGIKGASQTIFICMTDGFPITHTSGEGFGGGTLPLYAELHLTAWGFDNVSALQNVQFLKWDVINKSKVQWQSSYFSIVCDPDLGSAEDDYIGCDTSRNLAYCYNGDNDDAGSPYSYGVNPPAVGIQFLDCAPNYAKLSSFGFFRSASSGYTPPCEFDPNGEPNAAYNFMKGLKKDATPWVIPPGGNSSLITKYCFSGDPETGAGWEESDGRIGNCGGQLNGPFYPGVPGDRRFIMNYGAENKNLNPNDTQKILIAQLIARGSNNLNSVTRLKLLSDTVIQLCNTGGIFGVKEISSEIPMQYKLYQNYPNPFNPTTNIKFSLPNPSKGGANAVKIIIYDVTGKIVETLIDKELKAGSYSADWNASNFASGVYFYSLIINGSIVYTKKMVLIK